MDFNNFSNPSFNPKDWVNNTLNREKHGEGKEATVPTLMAKLQMYYQQVNNELGETSQNVMNNLPRVLHDMENISKEAVTLKQKMSSVKQELANVEKNTATSIASLEKIDKIKVHLVEAKQALYEADNWTVLSTDIETVFETGDIDIIASKLVSMQQSLNVLSNSSDCDNKKAQLEGLRNRLEALASPYVVEALTTQSVIQSKKYVKIFEDMGRFPLFVKYYSKCQKGGLIQKWETLADVDSDEKVVESFQIFYDSLVSNWEEQVKWCEEVMPRVSGVDVLVELYTDLLTTLSLEFSETFAENMKQVEEPLPWLLQVKNSSKRFAANLKSKVGGTNISQTNLLNLAKAIYLPYVQHISKYSSLQKSCFLQHLNNLTKQGELTDIIQTLGQKNTKVFALVTENRKLCLELTEGCSLPGFLVALEWFLKGYLEVFRKISIGVKDRKSNQTDFSTFQMCITILQNLGEFMNDVKQIDQECVEAVLSTGNTFKKLELDPFSNFTNLLLDNERQQEFSALLYILSESTEPSALKTCHMAVEAVCREVYQTSFTVIFGPIATLLEAVPSVPAWKSKAVSSELPDYSYAPQEYITQIGQYLMNLPQLLEPFLSLENPSLNLALSIVGGEFVQLAGEDTEGGGFVELFLGRIAEASCRAYSDHILTISSLGASACKQLGTDINYLGNVLEDLGFTLSEKLKNIALLVKLTPAEYGSQSAGISPQLVAAIRQMRNVISE